MGSSDTPLALRVWLIRRIISWRISYKGSTLEVGERSGLIIGPSGTDYTVTSSDPDTVAVEQVLTFWAERSILAKFFISVPHKISGFSVPLAHAFAPENEDSPQFPSEQSPLEYSSPPDFASADPNQ